MFSPTNIFDSLNRSEKAMSLSRKETEDLKPLIENIVNKVLGWSEPTLLHAAVNCLGHGYDKRKTVGE